MYMTAFVFCISVFKRRNGLKKRVIQMQPSRLLKENR